MKTAGCDAFYSEFVLCNYFKNSSTFFYRQTANKILFMFLIRSVAKILI